MVRSRHSVVLGITLTYVLVWAIGGWATVPDRSLDHVGGGSATFTVR